MKFEWDEEKRLANIRKHGIDLADAAAIFEGDVVVMNDNRFDYGETRFIAFGLLKDKVIVVAFTERGQAFRLISARKATHYEEINYFKQISN
jgi:uncharacterized DUF497 family protein